MSFLRSRRGVVTAAILLLIALFLVRPGADRLRSRIITSISLALGRPVEVASVSLRLLPQPGFDLQGFVVHENPSFGSEPMLRATEVTALLRLRSLFRGRLEISNLRLTEPSINLVRNPEGHWNLENLIERTDKIQVAPTGDGKTERRPRFPYIEAQDGRINIKFGAEKKPYALTAANFALWQDSENAWGMRLRAQPVRTDFNLSDTGTVRINGSWQRATMLRNTPLQFNLQWDRAQLGQLTKFAYGNDKGWRGTVTLSAALAGTPADLRVLASASAEDFRRYDIAGGDDLRLATQCKAQYSSSDNTLSNIACTAPIGTGMLSLTGRMVDPLGPRSYDFLVTAQNLPMQSLVAMARHAKQGLPDDLSATGQLDAKLRFGNVPPNEPGGALWSGEGHTSGFHLRSSATGVDLALNTVSLTLSAAPDTGSHTIPHVAPPARGPRSASDAYLGIGAVSVALGGVSPVLVRGTISREGYEFSVRGDAQLQKLLRTARTVGLPTLPTTADGSVKLDLRIAGGWSGFAAPETTGKAHLHSIHASLRGFSAPLDIASANLTLVSGHVLVQDLMASVAGTFWRGSVTLARPCVWTGACPAHFDLFANEIALDRLNQMFNPNVRKEPWYRFLSTPPGPSGNYLLGLNAEGRLSADKIVVGKTVGNRFSTGAILKNGRIELTGCRAEILGGKHSGEWTADFTRKPPEYSGSGKLEGVALGELADAMHDKWITGSARATYKAVTSGLTSVDLLSSAIGSLQIDAWDGTFPHITLVAGAPPLRIRRLTARLSLDGGKFDIEEGKLQTALETYGIGGTASLGRVLNLKLTREGEPGFNITGSLTEPRVSRIAFPSTQAALSH